MTEKGPKRPNICCFFHLTVLKIDDTCQSKVNGHLVAKLSKVPEKKSDAVTHPRTNQAQGCLTSVIGQEPFSFLA